MVGDLVLKVGRAMVQGKETRPRPLFGSYIGQ